jgi:hypothetical protein
MLLFVNFYHYKELIFTKFILLKKYLLVLCTMTEFFLTGALLRLRTASGTRLRAIFIQVTFFVRHAMRND